MAGKKQTVTPLRTEPIGIANVTYKKDGRPPMTRPFGLNWAARNGYPTGKSED
ncbi:MAG TPA: hypothetical protein VGF75_02055 [Candidatus Saccharimonadales bacterium]|jgi:hypothetical protein